MVAPLAISIATGKKTIMILPVLNTGNRVPLLAPMFARRMSVTTRGLLPPLRLNTTPNLVQMTNLLPLLAPMTSIRRMTTRNLNLLHLLALMINANTRRMNIRNLNLLPLLAPMIRSNLHLPHLALMTARVITRIGRNLERNPNLIRSPHLPLLNTMISHLPFLSRRRITRKPRRITRNPLLPHLPLVLRIARNLPLALMTRNAK